MSIDKDVLRYLLNKLKGIFVLKKDLDEMIDNGDIGGGGSVNPEDCYHVGTDTPENEDMLWFYTSTNDNSSDIDYNNPIITELLATISSMKEQIIQLQADVEYLKLNGGGSGGGVIDPDPDDPNDTEGYSLCLEDGGFFLLEDGGRLLLEGDYEISTDSSTVLLEDGSNMLLENNSKILLEK